MNYNAADVGENHRGQFGELVSVKGGAKECPHLCGNINSGGKYDKRRSIKRWKKQLVGMYRRFREDGCLHNPGVTFQMTAIFKVPVVTASKLT
jgi:hypothetical protein